MEKPVVTQISEGSLILDRNMGVMVKHLEGKSLDYIFQVYENDRLEVESTRTQNNIYYFKPTQYNIYVVKVNVYELGRKIDTLTSPMLDFIEDFVMIKEARLEQENGEMIVKVSTALNLPKEYYAYDLKKDGEIVEKITYTKQPSWIFGIKGSGTYSVQVTVRLVKNSGLEDQVKVTTNSISI